MRDRKLNHTPHIDETKEDLDIKTEIKINVEEEPNITQVGLKSQVSLLLGSTNSIKSTSDVNTGT